jgi:anti-anti-sigma factor
VRCRRPRPSNATVQFNTAAKRFLNTFVYASIRPTEPSRLSTRSRWTSTPRTRAEPDLEPSALQVSPCAALQRLDAYSSRPLALYQWYFCGVASVFRADRKRLYIVSCGGLGRPPSVCDSFGVIDEVGVIALYEDRLLRILLQSDPLALRLIGQADLTHRPALEQALRRAEQAMTDVLIDLAELEFIDVGGVRQMMDLAGVLAIDGRQVVISGVRPAVQPILQVCLWPQPANLQVKNANGQDLERPDAPSAPRKRARGATEGI